jgi:peptide chain release factor 2
LKKLTAEPVIYGGFFDVDNKLKELARLESEMAVQGFWDKQEVARKHIGIVTQIKNIITPVINFKKRIDDHQALKELLEESNDTDAEQLYPEFKTTTIELLEELDRLEIQSFLSGPHDHCPAILSIHAGAGGTESCDWADMLLRMYLRWAERRGYTTEIEDIQPGEEAGISRATIRIDGPNAYGYTKAERGVHRLVRISPFDSNKRRHTSFCAIDVIAELDDSDTEVVIKDEDLRIDTYRSSGKGGQHVNKTDSAIRITHLPTNIVAACQSDRSQHKNKATAMKMLKARLYEKMQDEKRAEMEKFYGEKGEMGWGNQIRSYVFQPYQMVKDLRTGTETSNVQGVMDGDIDLFVNSWLRAGGPRTRSKNLPVDLDE